MGYIDSDTHVRENDRTWAYFDPAERRYVPALVDRRWTVNGSASLNGPFDPDDSPEEYHDLFPRGSVDLEDPEARLRRMDQLGVDVQVLFSTFWVVSDIEDPHEEAALARSWNRWMAERTSDAGGRLGWTLQVPFRLPERAVAEMRFGKEHGAVGVQLRGARHGYGLGDPVYAPIFEAGRDLELVMAVHSGGDGRIMREQPSLVFLNNLAPVPGAFHAVINEGLAERFPGLRWAFLEAGASWLPFAIQQAFRVDTEAGAGAVANLRQVRGFREWRDRTRGLLEEMDLFVACEIDDDLAYLDGFVGGSNLVHGTDYGHMDMGSDPYGLHVVDRRPDVDPGVLRAIVDGNARRLWGIDPSFTPAPALAPDWEVPTMQAMPNWFSIR